MHDSSVASESADNIVRKYMSVNVIVRVVSTALAILLFVGRGVKVNCPITLCSW